MSEPIENAAYILKELKTPFLVVKNSEGKFVGIVTHKAIFDAYSNVLGLNAGHRIVLNMFDLPGQLAKLTAIIKENNGNITNLALEDAKVMNVQRVIIKVRSNNITKLIEAIKLAGFKVASFTPEK
jgi:acetoin utilization protein AcuB